MEEREMQGEKEEEEEEEGGGGGGGTEYGGERRTEKRAHSGKHKLKREEREREREREIRERYRSDEGVEGQEEVAEKEGGSHWAVSSRQDLYHDACTHTRLQLTYAKRGPRRPRAPK